MLPRISAALLFMILLLAGLQSIGKAQDNPRADSIEPDAEIQALIDRYIQTRAWTPEYYQHLIALRQVQLRKGVAPRPDRMARPALPAREGETQLIRQAAYYAKRGPSFDEDPNPRDENILVRDALTLITQELRIPEVRVIIALLPYIETSDDRLRKFIREDVLGGDGMDSAFERDKNDAKILALFAYLSLQSRMQKSQPWPVLQIAFWKAPTASLIHYVQTESRLGDRDKMDAILWAQHTVDDVLWKQKHPLGKPGDLQTAVDELDKLSRFDEWWVKLYVAEIVRRHKELGSPQILKRFRSDPNEFVSKAVDIPFEPSP